ncbi:MAG: putative signal transducing protein [Dehalococcoidia bacterium]
MGGTRDRRSEQLTLVAVTDNVFTAELLRDQLRQGGIPCTMRNREGGAGIVGGITGTFEIHVLEGDAGLAATILGDGTSPEPLPPPPLPPPAPARRKRRRWWR